MEGQNIYTTVLETSSWSSRERERDLYNLTVHTGNRNRISAEVSGVTFL